MRISIGGGGTDLPRYYRRSGGRLISAAINRYVYISINTTFADDYLLKYSTIERVATTAEIDHDILRTALDLPAWTACAYLLRAPVQRSAPVPTELRGLGGLPDAFPDGEPVGLEGVALHHLLAQARRLAGAVRCAGSGAVLIPDPGTAIDLVVHTTVWLEPEACRRLLEPVLGALRGSWDVDDEETASHHDDPAPSGTDIDRELVTPAAAEQHARALDGLDPGERGWLQAEADALDEAILASPQVLEGYAVLAEHPDGVLQVAAAGEEHIPRVLRHETWARNGVITYELRWYWHEPPGADRAGLALRRRRDELRVLVERAAGVVVVATGGTVVDDDGFLVAPESLTR